MHQLHVKSALVLCQECVSVHQLHVKSALVSVECVGVR